MTVKTVVLNLAICQKSWNSFVNDISKQFFMFQSSFEEGDLWVFQIACSGVCRSLPIFFFGKFVYVMVAQRDNFWVKSFGKI